MSPKSPKRRVVISYANMSAELVDAFNVKYPKGYSDYLTDVKKVDKPDGTYFYAVTIDVSDATYLVKLNIKEDDYDAAVKDLFDDNDDDAAVGEDGFPDDNTSDPTFSLEDE